MVEFIVQDTNQYPFPSNELELNLNNIKRITESKQSINVIVNPLNHYRIFVSIVSSFFFREQFLSMIYEIGNEYGLSKENFVFVKENIFETTKEVISQLKSCDGMIQFFIDFSNKNDLRWLDSEYFSARTIGIPIVRIKEKSQSVESVISKDINAVEVNLNDDKEIMKDKLKDVLEKLLDLMRQKTNTHYDGL